jgi:hypothetical protein
MVALGFGEIVDAKLGINIHAVNGKEAVAGRDGCGASRWRMVRQAVPCE